MSKRRLRIGIVAGEASGDILGANLIKALKSKYSEIEFVGIGGPKMMAQGCISMVPMEKLSVMGIVEVLKQIRPLLDIRRRLIKHFIQSPPDIFIGIDSPDFCIPVERQLKKAGIKTVHYVSPSVWAWRQKRVFKIKKSVDHVLCLLPFEKAFYDRFEVPATFVGHTLADEIPLEPDVKPARRELDISIDQKVVAIMPGSRKSEIQRMAPIFFEAAEIMQKSKPDLDFIIPAVNESCDSLIRLLLKNYPGIKARVVLGQSHQVMLASDAILLASGTAALEAMLLKKPMVVSYRLATVSWWLIRRLVKVKWASLPNLLANKEIVPEFLQHDAVPEQLAASIIQCLNTEQQLETKQLFLELHQQLKQSADERAATVVLDIIK